MGEHTPHEGPIDPVSPHSLHDLVDGDVPLGDGVEYMGFHVFKASETSLNVVLEGHIGDVDRLDIGDYDDVLELVDDLNRLVTYKHEYYQQDDDEALIDWAGRYATNDEEKAAENPDRYVHVPENPDGAPT